LFDALLGLQLPPYGQFALLQQASNPQETLKRSKLAVALAPSTCTVATTSNVAAAATKTWV